MSLKIKYFMYIIRISRFLKINWLLAELWHIHWIIYPKLPGLGDVRWDQYVSALTDIGYDGYTCIEVE